MSYQPIENYGIIGDMNTVALVGLNGSIDFMCFPDFDSPTIFAALLDDKKGGSFQIHPTKERTKYKQLYLPDTNVLLTRFLCKDGVGEVTDFMPVEALFQGKEIIRKVTTVRGEVSFHMDCKPRFNYAQSEHLLEIISPYEIIFKSKDESSFELRLRSSVPMEIKEGDVYAEFTLSLGETAEFILETTDRSQPSIPLSDFVNNSLTETITYWQQWMAQSNYQGRWSEIVNRSALVLKLLTSYKHGSIVAAPTFSLPESVGGQRNWDYRYTWIRDSSFTIYVLIKLGYKKEAENFMKWVSKECRDVTNEGLLGLMYTLDGRNDIKETSLNHLEGYMGSSPVRIGNEAFQQYQLDIYGELLDAVYLYDRHVEKIPYTFWLALTRQIEFVCNHWRDEDHGIWEIRSEKKDFLYSKLMCWVAIDRGIKIGNSRSFPIPEKWIKVRDTIHSTIFDNYWNKEKKSFVQHIGSESVDASLLLMPIVRFIGPKDPQWLSTLEFIEKELVSDCVVYRYRHEKFEDGLNHGEGTFSMCTFWYVECLSRAGQLDKARLFFEKMLGYTNHLGLYAEQLGFQGEHLGNFPQGFTHYGLIGAAYDLNRRLNAEKC